MHPWLSNRRPKVDQSLAELGAEPTVDQSAVGDADLTGRHQPRPGLHDRGIGTNRLAHARCALSRSLLWGSNGLFSETYRPVLRSPQSWANQPAAATAANTASEPLTGSPVTGHACSTSIRWGVDRPEHAEAPHGQVVHGAMRRRPTSPRWSTTTRPCGPPRCSRTAARSRVEHGPAPHADPDHGVGSPPVVPIWQLDRRPRRSPPPRARTGPASPRAPAASTTASAQPAARIRSWTSAGRGPVSARRPGREPPSATASAIPGVDDDPEDAGTVGVHRHRPPGAAWGCWPMTSSRLANTSTGRSCSSASRRATAATSSAPCGWEWEWGLGRGSEPAGASGSDAGDEALAPNAPPLATTDDGWSPGPTPGGVGLEIGGVDPGGAEGRRPTSPGGTFERPAMLVGRGPPALDLARSSARASLQRSRPTTQRPAPSDTAISASARVRCRRRTHPSPSATSGATRSGFPGTFQLGSTRGRGQIPIGRRSTRCRPAWPSGRRGLGTGSWWTASWIVCQPVQRHRWASSA